MNTMIRASVFTVMMSAQDLHAQNPLSVSAPEKNNSAAAELKSFSIDKRLEVNLFADETTGIANPICFRWDVRGRLWVLCTWAYPQLKPGEKPNDKLLVLEDTSNDGKADTVFTFADGLNMPTGFALGHGGAYIGNGRDLLHVRDTDGDGKADAREVLFTGFGTGDTHQNINSFTWTPGGELLFCQGLHCFSRVQTPWGIRKLDEHGSWRLRPLRRQLNSYRRTSGGGNPWGYAFGDWGEPFIKSNGNGISELLPGMVQTDNIPGGYWGGAMKIGGTRIKSMVIEIVDSPHLPDDLQGDFLIAGYFARNIPRLRPSVNGAGHRLQTLAPILTSTHRAFRPVDLSVGPDGALYVADWFNPIIGHYQASFRHPSRDKTRGRIWRITATGRPLTKSPDLEKMNAAQLAAQLDAPTRWVRQQARLRLMDLPSADATKAAQHWVDQLKTDDPDYEHKLFAAIGVFESHEVVNRPLLERLLAAKDYRARAYATRVVGRWHDRLDNPLALLKRSAGDEHPRVRLETIVAASEVREAESIAIAAQAVDRPSDRFIDFAFSQTVHALADIWKPALLEGRLRFERPAHLVRVVGAKGGGDIAALVRLRVADKNLAARQRLSLLTLLASIGTSADAELTLKHAPKQAEVLSALTTSARERNLKAPKSAAELVRPALSNDSPVRAEAIHLCAVWKLNAHAETIRHLATNRSEPVSVRLAATTALAELNVADLTKTLASLAVMHELPAVRAAALEGLARHDLPLAAQTAVKLLADAKPDEMGPLLASLLQRSKGANALAIALNEKKVTADTAKLIRRWLNAAGRAEPKLNASLDQIIGVQGAAPKYSKDFVARLAKESAERGNAANGNKVFQLPLSSCTACHTVEGVQSATTAVKGPNLTAVAAGLPVELLIESVLWPERQIKEGYEATTIMTKEGRVFSGFMHSEDKHLLRIRDLTTGKLATVQTSAIKQRARGGTVMPAGLTASLTRQELRDLIKFLSTLSTSGRPK